MVAAAAGGNHGNVRRRVLHPGLAKVRELVVDRLKTAALALAFVLSKPIVCCRIAFSHALRDFLANVQERPPSVNCRLQAAFMALAFGLSRNRHCQIAYAVTLRNYLANVNGEAADPCFQSSIDGQTLPAKDVAYLTTLATGLTVSFVCRSPSCLFYGQNHQWIKKIDSEQFRCPQCGMLYQPWSQAKGQFPAQKVLSMTCPRSGLTRCWPCKWPESAEDGWLNKMAEIHARDISTGDDLNAFISRTTISLSDLLDRVAVPIGFKKMEWNPAIEHMLHDATFPKSQWAHLKENGVWGDKLLVDPDTPVFE